MELWTKEHAVTLLPTVAIMILLAWVLQKCIGDKEWKVRMIPFHVVSAAIVLLEIGKQVMSAIHGYDLYHLPFHFCSLFIFMLPVMSLYRGKNQTVVRGITAALCTSVFLLMMIYPALIYSANDISAFFSSYFSFHTVVFHSLVVFAFILIVTLRLHTPAQRGEQKGVIVYIVCFCVVSATMAQLLKTNYNNFYSCNIAPLEALRQSIQGSLGYGATQAIYILIVTVLDILFVLGSYWLYRGLRRLISGKVAVKV